MSKCLCHNYKGNNIKAKGGNYYEYYNAYHYHPRAVSIVRRRRLLLEQTTVGVTSRIIFSFRQSGNLVDEDYALFNMT